MRWLLFALLALPAIAGAQWNALPPGAKQYGSLLRQEQIRLWPDHPNPPILFGQVEKETCITLRHRWCWTPNAKLETKREYGFGFGQFTVAYNADGSERFNAWREVRDRHKQELAEWTWENRLDPRLGLRAVVLYDYQLFRAVRGFGDTQNALRFSLAAYNGGLGGLLGEIKMCRATTNCDATKWYGENGKLGVYHTSRKSRTKWQGYGLSAYEINRAYVTSIEERAVKYSLVEW